MDYLEYKGYKGSVEYSKEDNCLFGKVLGMSKDLIAYEGSTLNELRSDFEAGIDSYLDGGKAKQINFQNVKQQKFYDLHPAEFTTAESQKIASSLHIQRRLAFTWRKKFCDMGIFEQVEHGKFKKCA